MRAIARTFAFVSLCLCVPHTVGYSLGQQLKDTNPPSGSIGGRVTLAGKPAAGVQVILIRSGFDVEGLPVARATTDQDGRFRLVDIPGGSFSLNAFAPAFVIADQTQREQRERSVTLANGEAVDGIDFSLEPGGVVTGKVTDSTGRPVVEETVYLTAIDERGAKLQLYPMSWGTLQTDDRGVYRVYGVPAGRYIVSVGEAPMQVRPLISNTYYPMTFHPGVTDESKATFINLSAGAEATGVDIVLGRVAKAYRVSGRIVDADTGKPLSNMMYGCSVLYEGRIMGPQGWIGNRSDTQGNFRLEGVTPNHYVAYAVKDSDSEYYSDLTSFDVSDADVSGLEIKMHRGSSISGVAMIDGSPEHEKLAVLRIRAIVQSAERGAPAVGASKIGPDGSFFIAGLRPGKVRLSIDNYPPPKGFALTRVEREGAEQPGASFDLAAGEQVSGLRVTIAFGTGAIHGQLNIRGGELPPGSSFSVMLKRPGTDFGRSDWWSELDYRNRFAFEELPPGDYEVMVSGFIRLSGGKPSALPEVKKLVTVTNDAVSEVTIVIELPAKEKQN